MLSKYKVSWCPVCNQGWVEIVKEENTGMLFLCCDECEAEWTNPDEIGIPYKGSRFKFGKIIEPSYDEIVDKGWKNCIEIDN